MQSYPDYSCTYLGLYVSGLFLCFEMDISKRFFKGSDRELNLNANVALKTEGSRGVFIC